MKSSQYKGGVNLAVQELVRLKDQNAEIDRQLAELSAKLQTNLVPASVAQEGAGAAIAGVGGDVDSLLSGRFYPAISSMEDYYGGLEGYNRLQEAKQNAENNIAQYDAQIIMLEDERRNNNDKLEQANNRWVELYYSGDEQGEAENAQVYYALTDRQKEIEKELAQLKGQKSQSQEQLEALNSFDARGKERISLALIDLPDLQARRALAVAAGNADGADEMLAKYVQAQAIQAPYKANFEEKAALGQEMIDEAYSSPILHSALVRMAEAMPFSTVDIPIIDAYARRLQKVPSYFSAPELYLSEEERKIRGYLHAMDGELAADTYFDSMREELTYRQGKDIAEDVAGGGFTGSPALASMGLGFMAGYENLLIGSAQLLTEEAIPITPVEIASSQHAEGENGTALGLVHDLTKSATEAAPIAAIGLFSPNIAAAVSFELAMRNAYRDQLLKGATENEAYFAAMMAGAADVMAPIEAKNLSRFSQSAYKGLGKGFAAALAEAGATSFIKDSANDTVNTMLHGEGDNQLMAEELRDAAVEAIPQALFDMLLP
jgi:hypothetical protein